MAKGASLESQLIAGAYSAHAKDPYNLVGQAQKRASEQLTSSVESLVKAFGAKDKKAKEETKGYDDAWEINQLQFIDDQGLGKTGWGQATDLAEEMKTVYDACPLGKEGNRCRRGSIIDLKNMAQKYADQKDALQGFMDTQDKIKNGDIDLSKGQSDEAKKILAGLNDRNSANRMKNDDEIASIKEQLKTAKPEEKEALRKQLEELTDSNERVVGWDIPDVGFMTADDLANANLLPVAATDIKTGFVQQQDNALEIAENLRTGAKGGKKYNLQDASATYGESITSKNMKSVFKDPLYGGTETIEDHLRQNPVITNLNYADLGIEIPEMDEDGVIDPEEWAKLSATDVDKVINEISNNEDLAKIVGGNYMAEKVNRAVNIDLYGEEYYPEPTGPNGAYTDEDRTLNFGFDENGVYKEGPTVYPTIQALREAIEWDRTHLRGDWENETELKKRGYIHGLAQSGTAYVKKDRGIVAQELTVPGDFTEYNE